MGPDAAWEARPDLSLPNQGNRIMDRQFFALSLGVGALLLATQHALAAPPSCADHASVVERLTTGFGETRRSIALGGGAVVETFASDETGTWTMIATRPDGISCLVAAGDGYEAVTAEKTGRAL